jgi:tRNA G18 (ribose-2'-O)-methylase SpoU
VPIEVTPIADPGDPRLDQFRGVNDAALLRVDKLFVAEGRLIVERVLADGRFEIAALMLNRPALNALRSALDANGTNAEVFECPTDAFESVTGFNLHRGCLALVRRLPPVPWQSVVKEAHLVVVMEAVTNADNVGSVFRNAAAFGVDAVLMSPTTCDPLYRKAIRTSMGHVLRVPFAQMEPWPAALSELRRMGFTIAALTAGVQADTLEAFAATSRDRRVALLVGSEGPGLTGAAERLADTRVRIPMAPGIDSLNLSVAAGIALSALRRF